MAVMSRDFMAEDSDEPPKEDGVGAPLGKVLGVSLWDEEESLLEPPPKKPPNDIVKVVDLKRTGVGV